ncbi:heterokaryon incompatibility protein-domain-containing protein [Pyrenochaeta sp. MPI-SDFR-AT-0127]|nr:heterokaryon incompatibility protein-domain-containing protein [Pyrenochaeta sp. MPI-SDFR-AT-0127]
MPTTPISLCQAFAIYIRQKQEEPEKPWADPVGSLAQTLECGCRYCYAACKVIGKEDEVVKNKKKDLDSVTLEIDPGLNVLGRYGILGGTKDDALGAEFRNSGLKFNREGISAEIFVLDSEDDPIIPTATQISGYTGSDQSFQTAMKWITDCFKNHRLCSAFFTPLGPPKLPLRVIDVSLPDSKIVQLVQTDDDKAYYACLSHCWGSEQPLKTTLAPDTLSIHTKGIAWGELPKTFQEAIEITRKFEIRYLWIDSLCIIQDDEEDWQTQSAQMADIYRNSVITIAGSAASSSQQGLFRNADSEHIDHALSSIDVLEDFVKVRKRKPLSHVSTEHPLLQRGWVFQERMLSPRYLHFGQNELLWECTEQLACECGSLSHMYQDKKEWLAPQIRLHPYLLGILNHRPRGVSGLWQASVANYSQMKLSYPGDIFPAISGIAKIVREVTGWTYVAGLWKETLITDLVWSVERPKHARRCEEWRAPTFSWASVEHKTARSSISYDCMTFLEKGLENSTPRRCRTDMYASVVETKCVLRGSDPAGKLVAGHIILSGTLIQATLRYLESSRQWKIAFLDGETLSYSSFLKDYDLRQSDDEFKDGDTVYCLKLIGSSWIPAHVSGEYLLYIVLRKITRSLKPAQGVTNECNFERIGLLRDAHGDDAVCLEQGSKTSAIQSDILVKIL